MSWIKKSNATINSIKSLNINNNGNTHSNNNTYLKDFDLSACYDSFKKHWQQIHEIINKYDLDTLVDPKHDDVLTVVNHLNQILTLIQVELRADCIVNSCIEYLLGENYLECLCLWTISAQKYNNSLRVEQLRIYEVLLSSLHNKLLNREAFLKPLIKLLNSFNGDCLPVDIEKKLVILINQLCSSFSQQTELLNLFFPSNCNGEQNDSRFDIFSLLVQFVHRDGMIGEQARDSLLLCMSLSKNNSKIAEYIISQSNICPVLAAGLNGLYSLLPRKLIIESPDWFRFAADDVYEMKELTNFMNSLEFCNVVIQVCHPTIKTQLYDYIYQGFLVPVMRPALTQEYVANDGSYHTPLQLSTEEELIATTAYFELLLRSVTHPGLLHAFIKFLLKVEVDGQRVIDCLVQRVNYNSKLCVVTLAVFETLIDLNCEDVMLELILKYLIPCTHIMFSQRSRVQRVDPYCRSAEKFFSLMINIPSNLFRCDTVESSFSDYHVYLRHVRSKIQSCSKSTSNWVYPYDGDNPPQTGFVTKEEDFVKRNCDTELEPNSLPSADDGSSGYESFKTFRDADRMLGTDESVLDDRRTNPPSPCGSETTLDYCPDFSKQIFNKPQFNQSPKKPINDVFITTPCIGPLFNLVFQKIEDLLSCDFYVVLRLTALISRLAIYPQPLIYSFLLDDSLVFQPCIKSLFQVLGLLKQKIESRLSKVNDLPAIVAEVELFLTERLENLGNTKKRPNSESSTSLPVVSSSEPFSRGDGKRKSFSVAIGAMFRRNSNHEHVESVGNGCYRYVKGNNAEVKHTVLCSLIINEWLKELAAITQEHTIRYLR